MDIEVMATICMLPFSSLYRYEKQIWIEDHNSHPFRFSWNSAIPRIIRTENHIHMIGYEL